MARAELTNMKRAPKSASRHHHSARRHSLYEVLHPRERTSLSHVCTRCLPPLNFHCRHNSCPRLGRTLEQPEALIGGGVGQPLNPGGCRAGPEPDSSLVT